MPRIASFSGVQEAMRKIACVLPPSPLRSIEIAGKSVWCKCESLQPIGAFKLRGAWHRLTDIPEGRRSNGVVAFSSGNHAQGVAWAARRLGMPALIVMPDDAPALKVEGTRGLGAEIVFYDRMNQDRAEIARQIAEDRGAVLVPSFDDPWVIEGQGTTGLEIVQQLGAAPDMIITPCGGGGLGAGVALALPDASIVLVEPEGWDDMAASLEAGAIQPVGSNPPPTACDALQTLRVSPLTFNVLHSRGAAGVSVSEAETVQAMQFAHREMGMVIEPGGAVALAALLAGKVEPAGTSVVILSGGNVDPGTFSDLTGI